MTIAPRCPNKECRTRIDAAKYSAGKYELHCPLCNTPLTININDDMVRSKELKQCPVCGGLEFFIRKDFPQRLGLIMVVIFGLVASIFYYREQIVATFATLLALVAVDAVIFIFVGKVSVCYKCRAEFRQVAYNPDHGGFDLATSEKYE